LKINGIIAIFVAVMEKAQKDKVAIIKSLHQTAKNKEMVRSYLKGKISLDVLTKKGIKFAKPL